MSGGASVDLAAAEILPDRHNEALAITPALSWCGLGDRAVQCVDDVLLFLFAGADCRLPCGGLLTWSGSNCLDLLLFGLLGFPIAPLLAFGHVLLSFDNAVVEWQYLIDCHQAR